MKAKSLYDILDKQFIFDYLSDEWYVYMTNLKDYVAENFKITNMGILCDFADEITEVFTAVFPSINVMKKIVESGVKNAMLFVHHASDWDSRQRPPFPMMNRELIEQFKQNNISIYCLHVPLDHYGEYSTGCAFASQLTMDIKQSFGAYRGALCGVSGVTQHGSLKSLKDAVEKVVDHKVMVYNYGEDIITQSKVALITGGGCDVNMLEEVHALGINTYITGVTNREMSPKAHQYAKTHHINIVGATHYSTEKFACIKMVSYFESLGIQASYISDQPLMEDL